MTRSTSSGTTTPTSLPGPARCAAWLFFALCLSHTSPVLRLSLSDGHCAHTGAVSATPLPLPLQRSSEGPLYYASQASQPDDQDRLHGRRLPMQRTRSEPLERREEEEREQTAGFVLHERQILPPPTTHPLTFIPGAFTRDAAAAACGPGKQLAAIDAYNWGQATSMTGGVGAWIRSWNTDNYQGTCIALYSINSINVPPQGCSQPLGALCEPGTPSPPPPPPKKPAPKKPPPKKPPPKKPPPKKKPKREISGPARVDWSGSE